MALVELPVLFRRGSVRRPGIAETLGSAKRNLPTHNMCPGTTSRSTGSKLPSGTRTVQVNTRQQELEARLRHARCVVRIVTLWDINERSTGGGPPSGTQHL
ncbi:MAG: hypothetical protein ACLQNE_15860 [Thermoguttaceae bacterium]